MKEAKKRKNAFSVTVGIPAYNEEANILHLLDSIMRQKGENFVIEKIIVLADNCTDKTEEKVLSFSEKFPQVALIQGRERKGKAYRLNELYRLNFSDILITFDADILLDKEDIIEKMAGFFSDGTVAVVAANGRPLAGRTIAEKIIVAGERLWYEARKDFRGGENIYNSGGCAFALKKDFAEKMIFPPGTIAEQELIYLAAKKTGAKFIFAVDTKIYYRAPATLKDFFIQAGHLKKIPDISSEYFGRSAEDERAMPYSYKFGAIIRTLGKCRIYGVLAIFLQIILKIVPWEKNNAAQNGIWPIALSTKSPASGNSRKKLRIAILDFDDIKNPLLNGGQARATYEIAKRLAKRGHKIEVISSKYPGSENREESGIYYRHIGLGSGNIRLNNIFYILALPFAVRRIKADIIIECFTAPISTLFSPVFTRIPVVGLSTSFDAKKFSQVYRLPFYLVENYGLGFYKYFISYTEQYKNKIKKANKNIFSKVIPLGVGEEYFNIKRKNPKHILFLGRIDIEQKGIGVLLEAYAKVKDRIGYPLVIAGNGPDEKKVKLMIKKLGLENNVIMAGAAYGEKKNNILSESLYAALPSKNETFCLFALESLASGLPIVAFDIPGMSWFGKTVSLKAKSFDTAEYSGLLVKAANMDLLEKLRKEGRKFALGFSWDRVADKFENFFWEVIKKEGGFIN